MKNNLIVNVNSKIKIIITLSMLFNFSVRANEMPTRQPEGYVASNETVGGYFNALSSQLRKPILLSKQALKKKISGEMSLVDPQMQLERIANNLGLIWYDNHSTIYIYDSSEMSSQIIKMKNISFTFFVSYLKKIGIYDSRYPLRGDEGNSTWFISGPPIYIDMVNELARTLDEQEPVSDVNESVSIIYLKNTFVEDRVYNYRDSQMVVPGVATILSQLFANANVSSVQPDITLKNALPVKEATLQGLLPDGTEETASAPVSGTPNIESSDVKIISNPGNNSLLLKAGEQQIMHIKNVVAALDKPRRHIELSVWIVDLQKSALEQLGANWKGSLHIGERLGFSLNQGLGGAEGMSGMSSTLDGGKFMAEIIALSKDKLANIISRPVILTQENIPAIFDNSHSLYTKLLGEHNVDLQKITFGTSVSVLPRFTQEDEIEMMLNVEDGNANEMSSNGESLLSPLPEVARTNISTIARVPRGKSLLIGGYTRDEDKNEYASIPVLGKIPVLGALFRYRVSQNSQTVRVFLIQPREIKSEDISAANTLTRDLFSATPLRDWKQNLSMSLL